MFTTYSLYTSVRSSILIQWAEADLISGATLFRSDWLFLESTPLLHCLQCQAQTLLWGVEDMQVCQLVQWCCTHNQKQISITIHISFYTNISFALRTTQIGFAVSRTTVLSAFGYLRTSASLLNSWWIPKCLFLTMSLIAKWQILTTKC